MDRLFRAMRNTGSARQAGEMVQTSTSVDGLETVEARNHEISRTPQARHRCAGGRANGGQLRWTVAPSQLSGGQGRSVERLLRVARASRTYCSRLAQPTEPPDADPHVRWCGRGEWATTPPIPIGGCPTPPLNITATKKTPPPPPPQPLLYHPHH